jgi:chromosomal replication initiation ATPase DnaA
MNNEIEKALEIIEEYDLTSKSRKREMVYKRAFLTKYLRSYGISFEKIGRMLNKNHATCVHYVHLFDTYKEDDYFLLLVNPLDEMLYFNENSIKLDDRNYKRITIYKSDYDYLKEIKQDGERFSDVFNRLVENRKQVL